MAEVVKFGIAYLLIKPVARVAATIFHAAESAMTSPSATNILMSAPSEPRRLRVSCSFGR